MKIIKNKYSITALYLTLTIGPSHAMEQGSPLPNPTAYADVNEYHNAYANAYQNVIVPASSFNDDFFDAMLPVIRHLSGSNSQTQTFYARIERKYVSSQPIRVKELLQLKTQMLQDVDEDNHRADWFIRALQKINGIARQYRNNTTVFNRSVTHESRHPS